jgi:hypothetical protein
MFGSFSPESLGAFYDSFEFEECASDEKVVFGVCRKVGQKTGEKDFDSSVKTKGEEEIEAAGKKAGSDVKSNKPFIDPKTGRKMGWAVKDGKPVAVAWGAVAGEKKVGPKEPKAKSEAAPKAAQPAPAAAKPAQPAAAPQPTPSQNLTAKANDPALSQRDRSVADLALKVAQGKKPL